MKRFLIPSFIAKTALVMAMAALTPSMMAAQEYENAPVTVSKEKIRIGGQICYSHIVLEKQTLYSISKAYNVSVEDIYKFNPGVKEKGLKKNSILIIPAVEEVAKAPEQKTVVKYREEAKPQEEAEEEMKPVAAEVRKVPAEQDSPRVKRKIHTVKWYEDLDVIADKYGVTPYAIMKANNLSSSHLTKRQRLIIPNPGEYPQEESGFSAVEAEVQPDDTTAVTDSLQQEGGRLLFPQLFLPKKEIEMSLLLPLKATGSTSSRQNMDFYSGVLLAVYDMANEGISTNLNVFDVGDGTIPSSDIIRSSDVVIGPVSSGDISRTFISAPGLKALVSPLDPKAEELAYSYERMIQAPTPHSAQHQDLVEWMKEEMVQGDTVLVVTEKGSRPTAAVTSMLMAIDTSGIVYNPLTYSILEGRDITETLMTMMTATNTNRVYIASESEAFVNDVVRNLNVMIHQKYNVVLYAPSKIRSFETIEVENFHNTNMRVSAGYYIDYNDPKIKEFLLRYRALFNAEPSQFAYQGYDVAKYFIGLSSRYGNRWMEKLDEETESMLQSTFDFERTPGGGYLNNGIRRIVYEDRWSVRKIR